MPVAAAGGETSQSVGTPQRMLFNSLEFILLFVPITLLGYFLLGTRGHTRGAVGWVILCSLFFYAYWNPGDHALTDLWRWWPLALICTSVVFNYLVGRQLLQQPSKPLLALGVAANLAAIGYFKYAGFFAFNLERVAGVEIGLGDIVLPLAISFFTFQQIAYLVDSYRGYVRPEGFVNYALFVTFFPQLIAGPIVHHSETIPQFARRENYRPSLDNISLGLSIFVIGLAKKVVLADGIAVYATPVFGAALAGESPTFFEAWGGALAYTFQLYFDFSGYSDMAIGLGLMFNIRLPMNFNSPYKAVNIIDFWRRWHITLSRFLRDYLYIPLGGNRRGGHRRYTNLFITMLLGGLWHGAGWTFVMWGGLHGLYLIINHGWHALRRRLGHDLDRSTFLGRVVARSITFLAVVVGWVYFRAEDMDAAHRILAGMVGLNGFQLPASYVNLPLGGRLQELGFVFMDAPGFHFGGFTQIIFLMALFGIAFLLPNTQEWTGYVAPNATRPRAVEPSLFGRLADLMPRWQPTMVHGSVIGVIFCWCLLAAFAQTPSEFLYFQF
jgi:alginate O-acetyltransferase complex protein AlgI